MKRQSTKRFVYYQFIILALFFVLQILNEVIDLPHILFGDPPTQAGRRMGEMGIEIAFWSLLITAEVFFIQQLRKKIKVLEGFIPICANCKKVRSFDQWKSVEQYISEHSLADFSHSICPECARKLYPDLADQTLKTTET